MWTVLQGPKRAPSDYNRAVHPQMKSSRPAIILAPERTKWLLNPSSVRRLGPLDPCVLQPKSKLATRMGADSNVREAVRTAVPYIVESGPSDRNFLNT